MKRYSQKDSLPWRIAAPSFVWPGKVGENCYLLQDLVDEVAIVLFEKDACLAYTDKDLPSDLNSLNLTYHVHLPLDLTWSLGGIRVFEEVKLLYNKVAYLKPWGFVLHPPNSKKAFYSFYQAWIDHGFQGSQLILENIEANDLVNMWSEIEKTGCSICLDIGHLLAYGQENILSLPGLYQRVSLVHLYGLEMEGRHMSLAHLSSEGKDILQSILGRISKDCVIVLELFDPDSFHESLNIFYDWFRNGLSFQD